MPLQPIHIHTYFILPPDTLVLLRNLVIRIYIIPVVELMAYNNDSVLWHVIFVQYRMKLQLLEEHSMKWL